MIGTLLALTWALMGNGVPPRLPPPLPPPVRLAPVRCADLPDATVRAPLRVELGERLLDDSAPERPDFLLVSIACNGSDATVLAVRQNDSGAPRRRLVPLAGVAPEARPRELALAAAELIHVTDVADAEPPLITVRTTPIPVEPSHAWTLTVSPSVLYWGGYFANDFSSMSGAALLVGIEHGPQKPASPSWQWALTTELTAFGGPYRTGYMAGLLALVQHRGGLFVPELGLGGREGVVDDFATQVTTTTPAGGPVASIGVSSRFLPGLSSDFMIEGGYDFGGPGAWVLPRLAFTMRFW
jgi:hypothetical protein